jgi:hypothetical protein
MLFRTTCRTLVGQGFLQHSVQSRDEGFCELRRIELHGSCASVGATLFDRKFGAELLRGLPREPGVYVSGYVPAAGVPLPSPVVARIFRRGA